MEGKIPKVSIVILNWNGKQDTVECVESLKKVHYPKYDIILVDNGSFDGSADFLEKQYPYITIIKNKENLGFTGGNNVGIQKALDTGAEYILLLNNDTTVDQNLITGCLVPFLNNQEMGIVGPKVVYYSNPNNVWCAGCYYNRFLGRGVMYGTFSKKKDFEKEAIVDWISFCVVMVKREVFESIGLLDNDFFSSYEDLDFCLRAKKAGYISAYTPKTIVKHKIAQDWGGLDNPLYIYYQVRNALLCMKKNRSFFGFMVFFNTYLLISMPRRAIRLFFQEKKNRIRYMYMALYDFLKGRYQKGILSEIIREEEKERKRKQNKSYLKIGVNARYLQRRMSGIERYILELILNLEKIDMNNEYLLFFNKDAAIPFIPKQENVRTIVSSFPTRQRLLRLFWEHICLSYEIKKNNVDIFHGPAFFVPIWKPKDCKYVITVHDITFVKYPKAFTFGTKLYYQFLFPRSLQLADVVITDSESTKKDIIEYYGVKEEKIKVIYLGISDVFLKKQSKEKIKAVKEKYSLPEKYLLFTGVLSPRKNVETIVSAFNQIKKEPHFSNHKLLIVGRKGWLYEGIFAKVKRLHLEQEVFFIDYICEDDLPVIYFLAEIYLFPSLYEGFGLPILEAMVSGCPVITSNISSMPEVAGDAALLINPLNVEELVVAIKKIHENPEIRKKLLEKGRLQIKRFSWEKTAEETRNIYLQLVQQEKLKK